MASHSRSEDDLEDQPAPHVSSVEDPHPEAENASSSQAVDERVGFVAKLEALPRTILSIIYRLIKRIAYCIFLFTLHVAMVPFAVCSICIDGDITILDYYPKDLLKVLLLGFLAEISGVLPWFCQLITVLVLLGFIITHEDRSAPTNIEMPRMIMVTAIRLGCLALAWLVANLSIPSLKRVNLVGSLLWKWSLLLVVVLLGYPILIIATVTLEKFITEVNRNFKGGTAEYYIKGLEASAALLMYFASILLVWLLCIHSNNDGLNRHVMLALMSLLAGAVLSVIKSVFLLWWETTFIYNRYKGKILVAGFKLYYIYPLFVKLVPNIDLLMKRCPGNWTNQLALEDVDASKAAHKVSMEPYMLSRNMRLQDINDAVRCVKKLHTTDNAISKLAPELGKLLQVSGKDPITETVLQRIDPVPSKQKKGESGDQTSHQSLVAKKILTVLRMDLSKETATYDEFKNWVVDALEDGFLMRLKLNGAAERMKNLDRVLKGSIASLVILIWLFITGLATTKVVVALASIFLGLSFMFADACKAFFLGLVFTFVMHPFDVGDRCVVNDKELLVKEVNILTTIFEDGYKDFVIYPNSDLATKNITKHRSARKQRPRSKPAAEDLIELFLHSSTTLLQIRKLQQHMDKCLKNGIQHGRYTLPYDIMVEEINGENIKMSIQFNHNLDDGDVSKKKKQRSELLLEIKQFLEDIHTSANQGFGNSTAKRSYSI